MDFRNFDLNLLRVLLEIHRTRSVTLAGQRLFLSQPATSQALGRLRAHFGDPLFVRAAGGLVPTELGERLAGVAADHLSRLQAALAAITAAVVGVILNLSVWFALHVLFAEVREVTAGPFDTILPSWTTLQPLALGLSLLAGWLLLVRHMGMVTVLALMAALGGALHLLGLL